MNDNDLLQSYTVLMSLIVISVVNIPVYSSYMVYMREKQRERKFSQSECTGSAVQSEHATHLRMLGLVEAVHFRQNKFITEEM